MDKHLIAQVERERVAQGLPAKVTDAATLRRLAALLVRGAGKS